LKNEIAAPETGTRRCVIRRLMVACQPRFGVIVSGFDGLVDGA